MFRVDADTLYSPEALAASLEGIMTLDTFLLRVKPRKRFKGAYWGRDVIEAIGEAEILGEADDDRTTPPIRSAIAQRRRAVAPGHRPLDPQSFK